MRKAATFSRLLPRLHGDQTFYARSYRHKFPNVDVLFSTEAAAQTEPQVLTEEYNNSRTIILNRPRQLNAISCWMGGYLADIYEQWEKDKDVQLVLIKGTGRAFSAGGDVAEVYHFGKQGRHDLSKLFFRHEYYMDYLVRTYKKPHVALMDGIVMGGGSGISVNGNFKVVTEKTLFAMPETALGLHPDVGASFFLSRLPGFLGEYVALTGSRLDGAELRALGLATHYVASERITELEATLKNLSSGDALAVNKAICGFSEKPECKTDSILHRLEDVNCCFSKSTVEEILDTIEAKSKETNDSWYASTLATLQKASPMSLKITLRSIREGRHQTFYDCLMREYRLTVRCLLGQVSPDFYEGCRAILIDKDRNPKWNPTTISSVTPDMVDHYFLPFEKPEDELQLPAADRQQSALKIIT